MGDMSGFIRSKVLVSKIVVTQVYLIGKTIFIQKTRDIWLLAY